MSRYEIRRVQFYLVTDVTHGNGHFSLPEEYEGWEPIQVNELGLTREKPERFLVNVWLRRVSDD